MSGFVQAPDDDALRISCEVMIDMHAGDVIKVRNASTHAVMMSPQTIGTSFPVIVANINIHCLKSLSTQ